MTSAGLDQVSTSLTGKDATYVCQQAISGSGCLGVSNEANKNYSIATCDNLVAAETSLFDDEVIPCSLGKVTEISYYIVGALVVLMLHGV